MKDSDKLNWSAVPPASQGTHVVTCDKFQALRNLAHDAALENDTPTSNTRSQRLDPPYTCCAGGSFREALTTAGSRRRWTSFYQKVNVAGSRASLVLVTLIQVPGLTCMGNISLRHNFTLAVVDGFYSLDQQVEQPVFFPLSQHSQGV